MTGNDYYNNYYFVSYKRKYVVKPYFILKKMHVIFYGVFFIASCFLLNDSMML